LTLFDAHATQGIDVGDVDLVLHVRPCEGLVRQIDGTVEKRFAKKELLVPLQVGCEHVCVDGHLCIPCSQVSPIRALGFRAARPAAII